jgi:hypothetical protein
MPSIVDDLKNVLEHGTLAMAGVRSRISTGVSVESVRIHVQGLSAETSARELATRFEPFGEVTHPLIIRQRLNADGTYDGTSPSKGFGFVTLRPKSDDQLALCLRTYAGVRWRGHVLRVDYASQFYLDRIAREKEEAAAGTYVSEEDHEWEDEDGNVHSSKLKEWVFRPELRIKGQRKSQLAVIDPAAAKPPNTRISWPADEGNARPSRINWEPIVGNGARTPGSTRWSIGGIADGQFAADGDDREGCDATPADSAQRATRAIPRRPSHESVAPRALAQHALGTGLTAHPVSAAKASIRVRTAKPARATRQPSLRAIAKTGALGARRRRNLRVSDSLRIFFTFAPQVAPRLAQGTSSLATAGSAGSRVGCCEQGAHGRA